MAAISERYGFGVFEAHVVDGDVLDNCGLCGGSLREIRVIGPRPRAIQEILMARDATGAPPQFYHRGCWRNQYPTNNWDPDVTIVCDALESPDLLDACPACPVTLPKRAPSASASATRNPWRTPGHAGRAVVEIEWPPAPAAAAAARAHPRVRVLHADCSDAHARPRLLWYSPPHRTSVAARAACILAPAALSETTRGTMQAYACAWWFGADARTRVHVVDTDDTFVDTVPWRVAIEEPLAAGGAAVVPARFARSQRAYARVPWSFECFVAAALSRPTSPHHTTVLCLSRRLHLFGVSTPLPHTWTTARAYVHAECDPADAGVVNVFVQHRAPLPTVDDWLAFFAAHISTATEVIGGRGTAWTEHPFVRATQDALAETIQLSSPIDAYIGTGASIAHGINLAIDASTRTLYLTCGLRPLPRHGAATAPLEWALVPTTRSQPSK